MRLFVEFCTSDPVRYQLLFQRTIPDFEPSPESYARDRAVEQGLEATRARRPLASPTPRCSTC